MPNIRLSPNLWRNRELHYKNTSREFPAVDRYSNLKFVRMTQILQ